MENKNILIVGMKMEMGGTEVAMLSFIRAALARGNKITLMLLEKTGVLLKDIPSEVTVKTMDFGKADLYSKHLGKGCARNIYGCIRYIAHKISLKKFSGDSSLESTYQYFLDHMPCAKEEYDAVFDFHGYGRFTTAYAAFKVKAPVKAVWIHDENIWWTEKTIQYMSYFDRIFCVSKSVKAAMDSKHPELSSKTEVLYNMIDTEKIITKASEKLSDDMFTSCTLPKVVSVGRLVEQKGFDIAVEVAAELKKRGLSFRWFVIGGGKLLDELSVKKASLGLGSDNMDFGGDADIIFLGEKPNPYPYIKDCTIYVQPSRHEGYAITLVEARVLCKPIVVSDILSSREQIQDGISGTVAPLTKEALADAIERLLSDSALRESYEYYLSSNPIDYSAEYQKLEELFN